MASTYISRTMGTPTSRKKWTLSLWLKKCFTGLEKNFFGMANGSAQPYLEVRFNSSGELNLYEYNGGYSYRLTTTRKFRDTNAWYHLVFAMDTTLATADDRFKVYVNGVQETTFTNRTNPSLNFDTVLNNGYIQTFGAAFTGSASLSATFDGSMSHVHFIDGTAYDASAFGEYDANGVWKIKTSASVTYGNNGCFILKDGNSVTDQSGNGNNFTASGTLTNTEDNPSNVFATMNPLDNYYPASTFSQGNTTIATASSNRSYNTGTLGASSGKYYWEVKCISNVTVSGGCYIGIASTNPTSDGISAAQTLGYKQYDYSYNNETGDYYTNNTSTSYGDSYVNNDIIGVAMDLDNNKLYFSKNGTWQNSGDPTSGATGTGAISIEDPSGTVNGVYTPGLGDWWTSGFTVSFNFGNGYFGTTAVASAGTNASGIGIFEYDVPTGFTALSTKGLNL